MTRNKGKIFVIASTLLLILSSCSNVMTNRNETEPTLVSMDVPALTTTPAPTITHRLEPSPSQAVPENIVKFQPFEITSVESLDAKPAGMLVLCNDSGMQLLRFIPDVKIETIPGITDEIFCLATSPDGNWLAYEQDVNESSTGEGSWLVVQSADWQQQKKVPMDLHWGSLGDYVWLDNKHLIFNNFTNPPDEPRHPYPMVVINPFTGAQIELSSDYPGLGLGVNGPVGRIEFNYSDVVYDPSLNLVIFPAWEGNAYIILWDRQTSSVLAKVNGNAGFYPLWSPDAKEFAVPLRDTKENTQIIEEWFLINRAGRVEQLTYFGDYFTESRFGSGYNWSPNGQKLAFWIDLSPSLCPGLSLAILDVQTKQVTDTCLPGLSYFAPPPIWSLDSRYVVIRDTSDSPIKTILVDLENHRANDLTDLLGDSVPIGWLVVP